MRPATRVVPKALLTVVDRPAIQYAVEEAARAGATEAILVVDLDVGHLIHQHFVAEGRLPGLEGIRVRPVVQEEPLGLGHAVYEAQEMVAGRPFFCILADDIVPPGRDILPNLATAADGYESVMYLRPVPEDVVPSSPPSRTHHPISRSSGVTSSHRRSSRSSANSSPASGARSSSRMRSTSSASVAD